MSLFHEADQAYFENLHTQEPVATGLAVHLAADDKHYRGYYLSAIGTPTSLRSIWASFVKNTGHSLLCQRWTHHLPISAHPPTKHAIKAFKRTHAGHLVAYNRNPELILLTNPAAANLTSADQRAQLTLAALPIAHARLEAWLQNYSILPVYPGLGAQLWPHLLSFQPDKASPDKTSSTPAQEHPLTTLITFGDCLGAWLVNPDFPWQPFVCHLLAEGQLSF